MKAQTLLTIIVLVASLAIVVALTLAVIDFVTDGLSVRGLGYGGVVVAGLLVLRVCAKSLAVSRSVQES